jgi:Tol biopolymer transport system component
MNRALLLAIEVLPACGTVAPQPDELPADAPPADAPPPTHCAPTAPFGAPTLVASIDRTLEPTDATLRRDELVVYFSGVSNAGDRDIYMAARPTSTSAFGLATRLGAISSPAFDGQPTLTSDLRTMALGSNRVASEGTHLYVSTRSSALAEFPAPTLMVGANSANPMRHDFMPFLTPDGSEVWWISDRSGSLKIYRATEASGFATVIPVSELGSSKNEQHPILSDDRLTIYFASNRDDPDALGDYDIYRATRSTLSDGFGAPTLVSELNSPAGDFPRWLSPDGCRLYFHSNRDGAFAIYVAARMP